VQGFPVALVWMSRETNERKLGNHFNACTESSAVNLSA
jgi:hypothetical protein